MKLLTILKQIFTDQRPIVLRTLADRPLYTMDIHKAIDGSYTWLWCELREMELQGLITSYYDEKRLPKRGGNRRRFYAITRKGRKFLENRPSKENAKQR